MFRSFALQHDQGVNTECRPGMRLTKPKKKKRVRNVWPRLIDEGQLMQLISENFCAFMYAEVRNLELLYECF